VVFDMHDLAEPEYGEVWVRTGSSMRRHARFEGMCYAVRSNAV
jgi:hypothetical protein